MRTRAWIHAILLAASLGGCGGCDRGLSQTSPAELSATPSPLVLPATYVLQRKVATVEVSNRGGSRAAVELTLDAPFEVQPAHLELARGEVASVEVTFTPTAVGHFSTVLQLGTLSDVPVEGEGLEVPVCRAASVCLHATLDYATGQCVEAPKPEGTACESRCVTGSCSQGQCLGTSKTCEDTDACTLDVCSDEEGCSHPLRQCPAPNSPCQVARCDSTTGCGVEDAVDGTLCGPDDCLATAVQTCIRGQCVTRVRPDTGRCANRWMPTSVPARYAPAMAYDAARQGVVVFGGHGRGRLADTWEWNGATWAQRVPVTSPPARGAHAMASEAARQRVVLFGGWGDSGHLSDTWEWDGTTWTQRLPATSPPARDYLAMAYDAAWRKVVLFGGRVLSPGGDTPLLDTWEWDGSTWTQRFPATSPPARAHHAMAYDAARQRVVLFGGWDGSGSLSDTWEWDGTTWTQRPASTSPIARSAHAMAYDPARQRVVLFGGANQQGPSGLADTWEWDGSTWTQRLSATSPGPRFNHALAYDAARQNVVLFGGGGLADTWEWDGSTWTQRGLAAGSPPGRGFSALAFDVAREELVLQGGWAGLNRTDTWEWDGSTWMQRPLSTSPAARSAHAMVYDAARQRVVLFGGGDRYYGSFTLADTWEWDGTSWTQRLPATSPVRRSNHALGYDAARQKVVLFGGLDGTSDGGTALADTWEWDGTAWTQLQPPTSPAPRSCHAVAFDAARQRLVLFGGWDGSVLGDTWEWDGTTWTQQQPATSPTPRCGPAMAYDAARKKLVLFGGRDGTWNSNSMADNWEWDGSTWAQRFPGASPPAGSGAMVYVEPLQRVVYFDGATLWVLLP